MSDDPAARDLGAADDRGIAVLGVVLMLLSSAILIPDAIHDESQRRHIPAA